MSRWFKYLFIVNYYQLLHTHDIHFQLTVHFSNIKMIKINIVIQTLKKYLIVSFEIKTKHYITGQKSRLPTTKFHI